MSLLDESPLEAMQVDNPTIALDLLAKDAHPMQQYRELTENAIQAVVAAGGKGQILWDVDWVMAERDDLYRLACIDTGEGMLGEQQQQLVNRLFTSGRTQGGAFNFGIGAKVTAGAKNPGGVLYLSWRDGESSMVEFRRNDEGGGTYGLRRFERDGQFFSYLPVPQQLKPSEIGDHGTSVVLCGETGYEDTIARPEGAEGGIKWLSRYLNLRYHSFPDGVTVRVREFPAERSKWPTKKPVGSEIKSGTRVRLVTGMGPYLEDNKVPGCKGHVRLADGSTAHWWILKENPPSADVYLARGHTSALFQSELYEVSEGSRHHYLMQSFGILYAAKRVVIYIEPAGDVTANVARSGLSIGGQPLPWDRWGESFKANLPTKIKELERSIRDAVTDEDDTKVIQERLKPYRDLFKVTSWRAASGGPEKASGEAPSGSGGRRGAGGNGGTSRGAGSRGGSGTVRGDYLSVLDDEGVPAERVTPSRDIPTVRWEKFSETDRAVDRAAVYVRADNVIFANSEFRVFTDMVTRYVERSAAGEELRKEIQRIVHEWYGQVLVEAVIRAWNFEHEQPWQGEDFRNLTSPEALTMAVLPFTMIDARIHGSVKQRQGRVSAEV